MQIFGQLLSAIPGSVSQGLIWGIMAIGVYITYRILDVADLTVDGSFATGGAVAVMLILESAPFCGSLQVSSPALAASLPFICSMSMRLISSLVGWVGAGGGVGSAGAASTAGASAGCGSPWITCLISSKQEVSMVADAVKTAV